MNPTPQPAWQTRYYDLCRELKYHNLIPRVRMKSFIEELLKEERTATLREMMEEVNNMKVDITNSRTWIAGHTVCAEHILKKLQNKLTSEL